MSGVENKSTFYFYTNRKLKNKAHTAKKLFSKNFV